MEDVATDHGSHHDKYYGNANHKPYDELSNMSVTHSSSLESQESTKRLNVVSLPKSPTNMMSLPL